MSEKNYPNEESGSNYLPEGAMNMGTMNTASNAGYPQNYIPPGNMPYNSAQYYNNPGPNNSYANNAYTAKNAGARAQYNQGNNNYAYGYGHHPHHHGQGYDAYHHHYEHPYGPHGYGAYHHQYERPYGPQGYNNYGPNVHMDDDYMKHHWSQWLHPGFFKSFMRSPRTNNFFRGVGVATVGLLLAPSVARVLRPIAVQVLHGVKDITDEIKGVVDEAREDMDDIFADANWESLKLEEDMQMKNEGAKS